MAKNTKEVYKLANEELLLEMAEAPGVKHLVNGILYKVLVTGTGKQANANSIVTLYYKGSLINASDMPNIFRIM